MEFKICQRGGIRYLVIPEFERTGLVSHAFTLIDSGNLKLHIQGEDEDVLANRKRIFELLGLDPGQVVGANQVHGNRIATVTLCKTPIPETDGLLTNASDLVLTITIADCMALFILDCQHRAIGLIHIGWRGALANIAKKAIGMMESVYGTDPQKVLVALGPSIEPCCYRAGEGLIDSFKARYPELIEEGSGRLDLPKIVEYQLRSVGLKPENIVISRLCTSCRPDLFFSYQASGGRAERMMAILRLRKLNF